MKKALYLTFLFSSLIFSQENIEQLEYTYYVGKMFTNNISIKFNAEITIKDNKITISSKDFIQEIPVEKGVNSNGNIQYVGNGNRFIITDVGGNKKFPYSIIHDIKDSFTDEVTNVIYQCYDKK